ncbi:hypothetical protein B296_00037091 [Ensete ventricosum]|uniref:Uncharacterized protein n=1 Tax=Ensete ventricosum TaxID=4639 RepID=A0A426YWZ1_ENSVE|nr:hypothetical protein B296_00037091 [Ensete ventricosum]
MYICPVGATFLFTYFPLVVSETTIPFGLLRLAEQLVPCSAPTNALARLRLFANTVSTTPFKAEDGIGLPEEVLNDTRFEKAAKFYFVYIRLDFLWSLNLLALIILNFLEVSYEFCLACKSFLLFCSDRMFYIKNSNFL